jgi:DNA-binding transcriptional MerR regulator
MSSVKYTAGEFAKLIGVSIVTLQRWDRQDKFKARRTIGGRRYYTEADLKKYKEMVGED